MSCEDHQSHLNSEIAYHFTWDFRREAALWVDERAIRINFHPLATELRHWLLRQGHFPVFAEEDKIQPLSFTNPYTYHTSVIAAILARCIISVHEFATGSEAVDDMEAEIECMRLYNEQVLYTARFCEAAIKQLLYCTQIPVRYYSNAALGGLLSSECGECKKAGRPRHKKSILGSLAHRYGLCLEFDHCLIEHLKIVNRRRNIEAAHGEAKSLRLRSSVESRSQLAQDSVEIGNELVHMLRHIADLEAHMMNELNLRIANPTAAHAPASHGTSPSATVPSSDSG